MCIIVDLPEPEGPVMATNSPDSMRIDTWRRAATATGPCPYVFETCLSSIRGCGVAKRLATKPSATGAATARRSTAPAGKPKASILLVGARHRGAQVRKYDGRSSTETVCYLGADGITDARAYALSDRSTVLQDLYEASAAVCMNGGCGYCDDALGLVADDADLRASTGE
jgi:hypothetical protein